MAGTMRPSDSATHLRAGVYLHPPQADCPILLCTLPPDYLNVLWTLVAHDRYFGIVASGTPQRAMTIIGADAPGTPVMATAWSGAMNQLWIADNVVGKLWNFRSPNSGTCLQAVGGTGAHLLLGAFDSSGHGAGQTWVYPNN